MAGAQVLAPARVEALGAVPLAQVACGARHSLAAARDGAAFAFGLADDGRLGAPRGEECGLEVGPRRLPLRMALPEGARAQAVAAGGHHSAVLLSEGRVATCGRGTYGQLGHGDSASRAVPTTVEGLAGAVVVKVACGDTHTLALALTGEVFAWGAGEDGQLGLGGPDGAATPARVPGLPPAVGDVACGLVHSAAVPALVQGGDARVADLEAQVASLKELLRLAEEEARAERRARLLAERRAQEAAAAERQRAARAPPAPPGEDEQAAGDAGAGGAGAGGRGVSVGVQTEGFLILPREGWQRGGARGEIWAGAAGAEPTAPGGARSAALGAGAAAVAAARGRGTEDKLRRAAEMLMQQRTPLANGAGEAGPGAAHSTAGGAAGGAGGDLDAGAGGVRAGGGGSWLADGDARAREQAEFLERCPPPPPPLSLLLPLPMSLVYT